MFHEKFREIAHLYPNSPAVVWQGETVSYRELDKRSESIAAELFTRGIGIGGIVPVRQERGAEWIAWSLGILKTGAAYLPISPSTPAGRLDFILRDCEANTAPEGALCVYYTSGSTGEPKGVVLSHSGVLSFCETHRALIGLSHGVRAAVQADVGFDAFLMSTLPILYAGGTLYLMDDTERVSLVGIHRFLLKNKIETTFLTSQLAVEYMRSFENKYLKNLLTGSEALRSYTPRSYAVYNLYGPTECTVYVTAHKLRGCDAGDIPIGAPSGDNRVTLVDNEICVSGPQLALGYLGRPEETARKFVSNPHYNPAADAPCYARMYRTGDLAERAEDGALLYRGRLDNMVKISGYRIEPGEVEVVLAKHPGISAVRVIAKPGHLAAYCVPADKTDGTVMAEALKTYLAQRLPFYMIPREFVMLEKLPVDERTGKVSLDGLRSL